MVCQIFLTSPEANDHVDSQSRGKHFLLSDSLPCLEATELNGDIIVGAGGVY